MTFFFSMEYLFSACSKCSSFVDVILKHREDSLLLLLFLLHRVFFNEELPYLHEQMQLE